MIKKNKKTQTIIIAIKTENPRETIKKIAELINKKDSLHVYKKTLTALTAYTKTGFESRIKTSVDAEKFKTEKLENMKGHFVKYFKGIFKELEFKKAGRPQKNEAKK